MMNCCLTSLGHCDLDIDLVSRIGIISYILLSKEFQIWCVYASWDGGVSHTIFGSRSHCNGSFDLFDLVLLVPVNSFSVMSGQVFPS